MRKEGSTKGKLYKEVAVCKFCQSSSRQLKKVWAYREAHRRTTTCVQYLGRY